MFRDPQRHLRQSRLGEKAIGSVRVLIHARVIRMQVELLLMGPDAGFGGGRTGRGAKTRCAAVYGPRRHGRGARPLERTSRLQRARRQVPTVRVDAYRSSPYPEIMNDVENHTLQVLKDIRSELRSLKDEVDKANERLDHLEQRQTATEIRLTKELTAVIGAIRDLKDTLVAGLAVKKQVDDHERRLLLLEQHAQHWAACPLHSSAAVLDALVSAAKAYRGRTCGWPECELTACSSRIRASPRRRDAQLGSQGELLDLVDLEVGLLEVDREPGVCHAASQVQYSGEVWTQVQPGTDVNSWVRRFLGSRTTADL